MLSSVAEFWITNVSKIDVSLGDLNFTIPSGRSFNLLDKKHFNFTLEQIQKSVESGSIFRKRDKIIIRKFAPVTGKPVKMAVVKNGQRNLQRTNRKTIIQIENKTYEELDISDEKYLEDIIDLEDDK